MGHGELLLVTSIRLRLRGRVLEDPLDGHDLVVQLRGLGHAERDEGRERDGGRDGEAHGGTVWGQRGQGFVLTSIEQA